MLESLIDRVGNAPDRLRKGPFNFRVHRSDLGPDSLSPALRSRVRGISEFYSGSEAEFYADERFRGYVALDLYAKRCVETGLYMFGAYLLHTETPLPDLTLIGLLYIGMNLGSILRSISQINDQ